MRRVSLRVVAAVVVASFVAVAQHAGAASGAITGPSSSQSPYVVRSVPGVVTKSILTVGDSVNDKPDGTPYRMVGIPDGLGAYDNGDGTFTVLMNHELGATAGVVRAHGSKGAFVSKWTIDKETLEVTRGEDLVKTVQTWDRTAGAYVSGTTAFGRLCSADLPASGAFFNTASGTGYPHRIFMNGEEAGDEGRGFAHVVDGPDAGASWEVPALGKFSYENAVASPSTGDKTVVVSLDDSSPGQVYVYVGDKRSTGNPAERAGLTGGTLHGIKVTGLASPEASTTPHGAGTTFPFTTADLGDVTNMTGAELQDASDDAGVFEFNRPEDGAWDPANPNDFYFVSTASFSTISRLWRIRFVDATDPGLGGTLEVIAEGPAAAATDSPGPKMMDNMTFDERGRAVIQEDPGNQDYLAGIFQADPSTGGVRRVAVHDADRFTPGARGFLTRDEESSGIIPVFDILGEGWYLGDVQAHYAIEGELVQGGQLFAMHVPAGRRVA